MPSDERAGLLRLAATLRRRLACPERVWLTFGQTLRGLHSATAAQSRHTSRSDVAPAIDLPSATGQFCAGT